MKNLYINQIHKDFFGKTHKVTQIGPYLEGDTFVLEAQYRFDMRRQKPGETQITKWELVLEDEDGTKTVLDTRGF